MNENIFSISFPCDETNSHGKMKGRHVNTGYLGRVLFIEFIVSTFQKENWNNLKFLW